VPTLQNQSLLREPVLEMGDVRVQTGEIGFLGNYLARRIAPPRGLARPRRKLALVLSNTDHRRRLSGKVLVPAPSYPEDSWDLVDLSRRSLVVKERL